MDFALVYLGNRFFYRIFDFFHHWYIDGSRSFGKSFMSTIASLDRSFALQMTIRHFFEPLYKDYSVVGRLLGVIFRTGRIIIALAIYLLIAALFAAVYMLWLAIPFMILYYAAKTF